MTIKCVAFDLDNTLWDCDSLIIRAEHKFYSWLEKFYPVVTMMLSESELLAHRMEFTQQRPELHYDLTRLRKNWMRELVLELGVMKGLNKALFESEYIEAGFQVFWEERNNVVFYDGVIEMLERLSKKYSLGVITNGNADVNLIGIGSFFDFTMSSEVAGVAKPHEDIFHKALQLSEHGFEETVYVGDDPRCDVLGPQKLGMKSLWYNPKLRPWPSGKHPAGIFQYHSELEDKIDKL